MNKVEMHADICKTLTSLYEAKNADYGDSFAKSFKEYGMTMPCIRLEDKLNRIKALSMGKNSAKVKNETIVDTLMDLANYAIMTIIECDISLFDDKNSTLHIWPIEFRCPECNANIANDVRVCHNCGLEISELTRMSLENMRIAETIKEGRKREREKLAKTIDELNKPLINAED